MDKISWGFVIAALYNSGIVYSSKGFGGDLGDIDPLFSPLGCVSILLWGLAYLAMAKRYDQAPGMVLVFALEKLMYGAHWLVWMRNHGSELQEITAADPVTGSFFGRYGSWDLVFMVFFGWVAWRHRTVARATTQ